MENVNEEKVREAVTKHFDGTGTSRATAQLVTLRDNGEIIAHGQMPFSDRRGWWIVGHVDEVMRCIGE